MAPTNDALLKMAESGAEGDDDEVVEHVERWTVLNWFQKFIFLGWRTLCYCRLFIIDRRDYVGGNGRETCIYRSPLNKSNSTLHLT